MAYHIKQSTVEKIMLISTLAFEEGKGQEWWTSFLYGLAYSKTPYKAACDAADAHLEEAE